MRRSSLVLTVFFIAFANGITEIVFRSINFYGLRSAVEATFGISAVVFACVFLVVLNIEAQIDADKTSASRSDYLMLAIALILTAVPHPAFSWIAITLLGAREYWTSESLTIKRRAAVLMLGITVPMFWGRLVFSLFSGLILRCDAVLVSLLTHSSRLGNVVDLPDGRGFLYIAAPCSSFANISLAILCWLAFTVYSGRRRSFDDYATCVFAIVNVIIINVARISILAKRPDLYDTVHGPLGATIVSWLTAIVVLVICASGVKREQTFIDAADDGLPSRGAVHRA